MSWREKFKESIEGVLNYGIRYEQFTVHLITDYKYEIRSNSEFELDYQIELETETIEDLASHWKSHVRNAILIIINKRIDDQLRMITA